MPHPEGTRAWRKGWRKRWREGSSFRSLSPVARCLVLWVEENADDTGHATTTLDYLWRMMKCSDPRTSPSRSGVYRALKEAERAGILRREAERQSGRGSGTGNALPPMTITRVNFAQYQKTEEERGKEAERESGTDQEREAELSSRRTQTKENKKKGAEAPPAEGWQALIATLTTAWQARYPGTQLVWAGRDFKAIKTLLGSIPDTEVARRFGNYLANPDPFYAGHPVTTFASQVNRFVAAPVRAAGFATAESHESFAARGGGVQAW